MTQYNMLKSARKNGTEVILNLSPNIAGDSTKGFHISYY